jgi:hypothetical protein
MKKIRYLMALLILLKLGANGQEKKDEPKYGITFSGFVKTDAFYDSRQTINSREGHFLLYPENVFADANSKDINAKPNFNMLSIQSRLKGAISGPEAFGAKTCGVIEADFFGNSGSGLDDVNGFRLRHAFVKLNWKTTEILAGQYWHPMFIAESFPDVISFNTGAPFQPFSRNPQIRITQKFGQIKLIACAFSQRDFQSIGPDGCTTKYLRNSGIPNAHFQIQYKPDSADHVFGIGVDYKILAPRLYGEVVIAPAQDMVDTTKTPWHVDHTNAISAKHLVNETLGSLSAVAYMKLKFNNVTIKVEGVYAQNAFDLTMIGGYAVQSVSDPLTDSRIYTNLSTASGWLDIQTNGKKIQLGLFAGYTKNLGSADTILNVSAGPVFYARGSNIDNIYRIAPRIIFISGKMNVALEMEYTNATYGKANGNSKGGVTGGTAYANTRGLLAFIYKF